MLHNLDWLAEGQPFPPSVELERIVGYTQNKAIFENKHWNAQQGSPYYEYAQRITDVVGNLADFISFPVLFNYQRLMALKTADLVCGEYPLITGKTEEQNKVLKELREDTDLDSKLYATVISLCQNGDNVWRVYKDEKTQKYTFVLWDMIDWFPIVSQDGTFTIVQHVIAWIETLGKPGNESYKLHVQIHTDGVYEYRVYEISAPNVYTKTSNLSIMPALDNGITYAYNRTIGKLLSKTVGIKTGLETNAIIHVRNMNISGTVYGFDDYTPIDSIIAEIMTRVAQISRILDKHADPSMTGPPTMLVQDKETGELYFRPGKFYATVEGEPEPKYITWDGQLDSSFKQLELLLNQLYILSEMGSALLGAGGSQSGQAISGTAMRFKMVNPLAKARRLSNLMTIPVKQLLATIANKGYGNIKQSDISIVWQDGLPDDPREIMELAKLATGETRIVPIKTAIIEMLKRTPEEAERWVEEVEEAKEAEMERTLALKGPETEPDGSYKKKGSSQEKGSTNSPDNANAQRKESKEDD